MKKLYVGNLPYSVKDADLQSLFEEFGTVLSAVVIVDRMNNNRSKGFGFVEMEDDKAADEAIKKMNDKEIEGRNLKVNEARPRE